MKARHKSNFLNCVASLIGAIYIFVGAQTFASTTQFILLNGYVIVIPVTVNGMGPFEFVLDTGTNTTLISVEFARAMRLRPVDRVELVTVTGSRIVPRTQLESLSVGSKTQNNLEALFSDLREVRAVKPEIKGVLGMNFLARFNFLINYTERRIVFEDNDELEKALRGPRLPLEAPIDGEDGRGLINRTGNLRLKLDSGSPTLILFKTGGRADLNWESDEPPLQARSDLGDQLVRQKRLRCFSLGGVSFFNLPVALMESKAASGSRIEDGLLPTSLFKTVYFNSQKKFVMFNPKVAPAIR